MSSASIMTHRAANFGLKIPIRASIWVAPAPRWWVGGVTPLLHPGRRRTDILPQSSAADPDEALTMTRPHKTTISAILAVTLTTLAVSLCLAAQGPPASGGDAKACQFMPKSELEAVYGGTVTNPRGFDGASSVCTVNIGGLAIKLQSAPPGTEGVPISIQQGLVGARLMLGEARQRAEANTKDFGNIGCLRMKMTKAFDGKPLAKPLLTTSCFLVEGGYLNISVAGDNPKQVRFDLVKGLLEKAAARR